MDISFIMKMNENSVWILIVVPFTCILVYLFFAIIYWLIQPTVLIYQYDTGIVIKRNIKIEYTSIERVYYKNHMSKKPKGNYYRDSYVGTIFIELKSGKIYKIRNAEYPIGVVDVLSRIKQQKKFR